MIENHKYQKGITIDKYTYRRVLIPISIITFIYCIHIPINLLFIEHKVDRNDSLSEDRKISIITSKTPKKYFENLKKI